MRMKSGFDFECPFDDPHLRAGDVTRHCGGYGYECEGSRHGGRVAGAD